MSNTITARDVQVSILHDSLREFIEYFWGVLEFSRKLHWNWHMDLMCDVLERASAGDTDYKRIIINIPPGTTKSLIVSVFWPCWCWARNPECRVLTFSYSADNTTRDSKRSRNLILSDKFKNAFPNVELAHDQNVIIRYSTTVGGYRVASSVGGLGTGQHPDIIIIDDPHKAVDCDSVEALNKVWNWFCNTVVFRGARNPIIVIPMQRIAPKDLSGRLLSLENSKWHHLLLPMEYEPEGKWQCKCHQVPDPRDPRTELNELLAPAQYPRDRVDELKISPDTLDVARQLQQHGEESGGTFFRRDYFTQVVDIAPSSTGENSVIVRGWDTAETDNPTSDSSAGVKVLMEGDVIYVCHCILCKTTHIDDVIVSTAVLDGEGCKVREEREPGGSGVAVIRYHRAKLAKANPAIDFDEVVVSRSKKTRARPFRNFCMMGKVKLVQGRWNHTFIDAMVNGPDDVMDGVSCAVNSALAILEQRRKDAKKPKRRVGVFRVIQP